MPSISVACYKPRPGCEQALLDLVRNHPPPLRSEGLVTDRPSIVMRTAGGTIVEVFEWVSQEAIAGAHHNPVVLDLWIGELRQRLPNRDSLHKHGFEIPIRVNPCLSVC